MRERIDRKQHETLTAKSTVQRSTHRSGKHFSHRMRFFPSVSQPQIQRPQCSTTNLYNSDVGPMKPRAERSGVELQQPNYDFIHEKELWILHSISQLSKYYST